MPSSDPTHPLLPRYRQLREELDAAYTAEVWNSEGIDRIVHEVMHVERVLARGQPFLEAPAWAPEAETGSGSGRQQGHARVDSPGDADAPGDLR